MVVTSDLVAEFFADTPGAKDRLHLDNCGSALMATSVITAIKTHLEEEVMIGGYVMEERLSHKLSELYQSLQTLFGGSVRDYAIASSAVDAWTKGFYSVPLSAGDVILTSYNEYCANAAAYAHRCERDGVTLRVAPSHDDGSFDLAAFGNLVDDKVKLISISHMPCSSGQVAPAKAIGKIAREAGAVYCLDACQTAGQIAFSVDDIGCDILSGTSRKFLRGPRGAGFLYLSSDFRAQMSPMMRSNNSGVWTGQDSFDWRSDATQFETWEKSTLLRIGFGTALDGLIGTGPDTVYDLIADRAMAMRKALSSINGVRIACPPDATGAIIGLECDGWQPAALKAELENKNCAVQMADAVHTRYDFERRGLTSLLRVSPHCYTRDEDIDRFCALLEDLIR